MVNLYHIESNFLIEGYRTNIIVCCNNLILLLINGAAGFYPVDSTAAQSPPL